MVILWKYHLQKWQVEAAALYNAVGPAMGIQKLYCNTKTASMQSDQTFLRSSASDWSYFVIDVITVVHFYHDFLISVNPFPHIDAFWRLCSRQPFENIVTKEEIAQNVQFLLLPQCFRLFVIGYPFNYGDFLCFDKICLKSSAAELSYEGKG